MALSQQKIPDEWHLKKILCGSCSKSWYCTSDCLCVKKATGIFRKVQDKYDEYNGDTTKIWNYIKMAR